MPFQEMKVEPEVRAALREIGNEVRRLRTEWGRSQRAVEAATGIDQTTISRLENGLAPTLRLERLARIRAAARGWRLERRAASAVPTAVDIGDWRIDAVTPEGEIYVASATELAPDELAYGHPDDPDWEPEPGTYPRACLPRRPRHPRR